MKTLLTILLFAQIAFAGDDDFDYDCFNSAIGNGTSTASGCFDDITGEFLTASNSSSYDSMTATYTFDGTSQYLAYGSTATMDFNTGSYFSVFIVFSTTNEAAFGGLVSKWSGASNDGWFLAIYKPSSDHILVGQVQDGTETYMLGSTDLNDGLYHVCAFTYSALPTTNGINLYVDGVRETMTGVTGSVTDMSNNRRVSIGARDGNTAESPWNMSVRRVEIFDRAFSAYEVLIKSRDLRLRYITR